MKPYFRAFGFLVLLVPMLLSACTFATTTTSYLDGQFVGPWDGAVVVLGATIGVGGEAYSSRWPITQLIFYDNGMPLGVATDLTSDPPPLGAISDVDGGVRWTPTQVGWNYLQMQIAASGHYAMTAPIRVCVVDFTTDPGWYHGAGGSSGYEGPCPIPDRDASAIPGTVTMSVSPSPDHLVFDPGWPSAPTCPGLARLRVLFQALVNDPPEDVALVSVQYSFGGGGSPWSLILTQTGSFAPSARLFSGTTDDFTGVSDPTMTWTALAYGRDGSTLLTDGPHTIPASPCSPVPLSAPFTPPAPTATPASARDCPSGTFFAEQTHKCIPVQIVTAKPGHGGGCSQYGDPSSCTSNGCSWDKPSSTCH